MSVHEMLALIEAEEKRLRDCLAELGRAKARIKAQLCATSTPSNYLAREVAITAIQVGDCVAVECGVE